MINKIRDYFINNFELLNPAGAVGIDYLGPIPAGYSIESGIGDPWVKRYIDGGGIRQYNFLVTSREWYGSDAVNNADNLKFYEYLADQIESNNQNGIVPNVAGAVKIEVLTNGYLFSNESDSAKYQIQLRLIYTS